MNENDTSFEILIKLVIIGDSGVGKSNYLYRFVEGEFCQLHESTIGFDYKSKITMLPESKINVKFQVWDTAGQEQYMSINKNLFQRVQGIILMYDISAESSFQNLGQWMDLIKEYGNNIPLILIGNKIDLEEKRAVPKEKGEEFAKQNNLKLFESSGKTGVNVEESFRYIGEKIIALNKKDTNSDTNSKGKEYVISKETTFSKNKKKNCC